MFGYDEPLPEYDDIATKTESVKTSSIKRTPAVLSKFEKSRLLDTRTRQISYGAPILVDPKGETDSFKIAIMELEQKVIPLVVARYLADGTTEYWNIDEFETI